MKDFFLRLFLLGEESDFRQIRFMTERVPHVQRTGAALHTGETKAGRQYAGPLLAHLPQHLNSLLSLLLFRKLDALCVISNRLQL